MGDEIARVEKPWGYELHWAKTERYVGKLIHVNAGHALSLQYHNVKDETIYLHAGKLLFEIEEGGELKRREMLPGERVHIHDGGIFINGQPLHETYTEGEIPWDLKKLFTLGADEYFVIGDNRATSIFVPIQRHDIIGKIVY